jgi:hypothetical protein
MNDRWDECGEMGKSPACAREQHSGCAHLAAPGAGFNPRRLRLEAGGGLCPCSCHSACPVALADKRITVPFKTWRESCTCPGAEPERRRLDEAGVELPDFDELWEDRRRRSRGRTEAYQAARARAAGQGRDEIREIYLAELNARGVKKPSDTILDAVVDRISGNPLPAVRVAAEGLVQVGKGIHALSRIIRSGK